MHTENSFSKDKFDKSEFLHWIIWARICFSLAQWATICSSHSIFALKKLDFNKLFLFPKKTSNPNIFFPITGSSHFEYWMNRFHLIVQKQTFKPFFPIFFHIIRLSVQNSLVFFKDNWNQLWNITNEMFSITRT